MNRRHFLSLIGAAPLAARSYFFLGPSWEKHASGLVVPRYVGELVGADGVVWHQFEVPKEFAALAIDYDYLDTYRARLTARDAALR